MAMARFGGAARVGAAAVAVGVALAGPGVAVAVADSPESDPAPTTADAAAPAKAAATRPAARAHRPAATPRDSAVGSASTDRPVTAARVPQREPARSDRPRHEARPPISVVRQNRAARATESAGPVSAAAPAVASVGADLPATAAPPTAQTAAPSEASPQAAPTAGIAAPVAGRAAQTVTGWLDDLFSPIRAFVEGVTLLVRRTLFNEAPTVSPGQTTGQVDGPISGSVGAIDPEGDPIVYSVSQAPAHGTVVVGADGSYDYTPDAGFAGTDSFTVTASDQGFHINLLDIFRAPGTDANVIVRQGVAGPQVQFNFVYRRGAQLWTPAARSALESVATMLASNFEVSTPITLTFDVTGEFSILPSSLASAGSDLISSDPGFHPTVVQHKILTGLDANGAEPDGEINWNFGYAWAFSGPILGSQYDFRSTAMHELLHTLGFLSNASAPGQNTYRDWTAFDQYIATADGVSPINADYTWNTAYDTNLVSGNGGLFFIGPNAVAAYGRPVPLYTPSLWESGSSMSHLDDRTFVGANEQLMNAQADKGVGVRELSAIERGILKDLGYTLVGDPGALAFIFFGFAVRRRPTRPRRGAGQPPRNSGRV